MICLLWKGMIEIPNPCAARSTRARGTNQIVNIKDVFTQAFLIFLSRLLETSQSNVF